MVGFVWFLRLAMECIVGLMVCLTPWAFGGVGAGTEFFLFGGVALLLTLWGIRMHLEWQVSWAFCPVAIGMAMYIGLGIFQLVPLPDSVLAWLSPATEQMYKNLLPAQPEALTVNEASQALPLTAGSALSLYPYATRQSLVHLFGIFALFVVVRNNVCSPPATRRLGIALLVNGSALSLFAIIQHFSTREPGIIYWTYATDGAPFGPFVNRNHFAFYINLCIGLAASLLVFPYGRFANRFSDNRLDSRNRFFDLSSQLLRNPVTLWIAGGLALMFCSMALCLSRGGYVAMAGALSVCLVCASWRGVGNLGLLTVSLSATAALTLLTWFGWETIEARLETLWSGEALGDARVFLLSNAWSQIAQFPVWGTGYGTFEVVEPLQLHTTEDVGSVYEHAHNDYLEDLIEGGFVRLGLRLTIIAIIFGFALAAWRRHAGTSGASVALGLLFSFTALVIHSFFEFGLYIPSIAVLATVVCAHLCSLAECPAERESMPGDRMLEPARLSSQGEPLASPPVRQTAWMPWPFPPVVAVFLALFAGYFLYFEGLKAAELDELRTLARRARRAAYQGLEDRAAEIPFLAAMVELEPSNAKRRFLLAEAHFDVYKQLSAIDTGKSPRLNLMSMHLQSGLKHVISSRNLCPLLPAPHARIASYIDQFASSDSRATYIDRAKFLAPVDPQLWYFCGLQELADQRPEEAWISWQQSLKLSDRYLTRILDRGAAYLTIEEMLHVLLPQDPAILLASAIYLFPPPGSDEQRKPLLESALAALEDQSATNDAQLNHTRATIYLHLGQSIKALEYLRLAVAQNPRQHDWRYDLANLLRELGQPIEARRELLVILGQQPNHSAARQTYQELSRELDQSQVN